MKDWGIQGIMTLKIARLLKPVAALAAAGALLTGCVSADALLGTTTMEAKGPAPAAPEPRLGDDWQAPEPAERRGFDTGKTVVTLGFDDGNASQYPAAQVLTDLGLRGTFYVNSSVLDTEGYLSRNQLDTMVRAGHEIGGHGVQHRNLKFLDEDEMLRQICWDRQNLLDWGYQAANFAFPEAGSTKNIEAAAELCGYNSARGLGAVESVIGCEGCGSGESFKPANLFQLKAPAMIDADWTLQDMKDLVLNAERDNADWVSITYHHTCPEACNELSIDIGVFEQFATWLKEREKTTGTVVRTTDEVIKGQVLPVGQAPSRAPVAQGNIVVNSDITQAPRVDDFSRCWQASSYGRNTGSAKVAAGGAGEGDGLHLEVTDYQDGDFKFLQRLDLGECASDVIPGQRYKMSAKYKSTTTTQFVVYLRDSRGDWLYWTASDWLKPSGESTQAAWISPEIPEGFTGLSFGLSLFSEGELDADDIEMSVYTD